MKLWQKDNTNNHNDHADLVKKIETFTVGNDREMDMLLAEFDVMGSLAHGAMLNSIGLLTDDEHEAISAELRNIYKEIIRGNFIIEEGVEDVHSQVELLLTERLGDTGKKIHSGRSRNDQVLLDLKLFMRDSIKQTVENVQSLFHTLIALSEKHKDKLLPGYTHLQIAMPSSFGLWFGAYAESLVDDLQMLQAAYRAANKNPLGSAAGYGSSFPLNRTMTTELLGFDALNYNVVYAQMSRGKTEKLVSMGLASVAATLSRMAMDVCLFMSQNFGFVGLPDALTTGSSIMPHKKNPDVFELVRARCNRLQALPNEIAMVMMNLPSGYHRDMQVIKDSLLPAFSELDKCMGMMNEMVKHLIIKESILMDDKYEYIFSVEVVNAEVLKGVPFRDAYQKVGKAIEEGRFEPPKKMTFTHEGSIGNLCNASIMSQMSEAIAGFNFARVEEAVAKLVKPSARAGERAKEDIASVEQAAH
jgi:argininosuccinate lyase